MNKKATDFWSHKNPDVIWPSRRSRTKSAFQEWIDGTADDEPLCRYLVLSVTDHLLQITVIGSQETYTVGSVGVYEGSKLPVLLNDFACAMGNTDAFDTFECFASIDVTGKDFKTTVLKPLEDDKTFFFKSVMPEKLDILKDFEFTNPPAFVDKFEAKVKELNDALKLDAEVVDGHSFVQEGSSGDLPRLSSPDPLFAQQHAVDFPEDAPAPAPVDDPVDAPVDAPVDDPVDTPAPTPVDAPVDDPVDDSEVDDDDAEDDADDDSDDDAVEHNFFVQRKAYEDVRHYTAGYIRGTPFQDDEVDPDSEDYSCVVIEATKDGETHDIIAHKLSSETTSHVRWHVFSLDDMPIGVIADADKFEVFVKENAGDTFTSLKYAMEWYDEEGFTTKVYDLTSTSNDKDNEDGDDDNDDDDDDDDEVKIVKVVYKGEEDDEKLWTSASSMGFNPEEIQMAILLILETFATSREPHTFLDTRRSEEIQGVTMTYQLTKGIHDFYNEFTGIENHTKPRFNTGIQHAGFSRRNKLTDFSPLINEFMPVIGHKDSIIEVLQRVTGLEDSFYFTCMNDEDKKLFYLSTIKIKDMKLLIPDFNPQHVFQVIYSVLANKDAGGGNGLSLGGTALPAPPRSRGKKRVITPEDDDDGQYSEDDWEHDTKQKRPSKKHKVYKSSSQVNSEDDVSDNEFVSVEEAERDQVVIESEDEYGAGPDHE